MGITHKHLASVVPAALAAVGLFASVAGAQTLTASPWTYDPDNTGTVSAAWVVTGTTTSSTGSTTPTLPAAKNDCKNGGWNQGPLAGLFKNQGDCVSTFEHNQHATSTSTTTYDYALSLQKNASTTVNAAAGATIDGLATSTLTELGFDYKTDTYCSAGSPRFNVNTTAGTYYFFGCTYGTHTDLGNGYTQVRFSNADAYPADGVTAFPGFGSTTVTSIDVVQDEEGQALLDNIDVNGTIITGP
jgi:hypothetical protein